MSIVLEEHGDGLTQVIQLEFANIVPAHEDFAFFWVVQASDEFQNGTFSGSVRSYDNLFIY